MLSGVYLKRFLLYLYDVIIFSKLLEEHIAHVEEVISLFGAASIYLKLSKWYLFKDRVDYLGHDVMNINRASSIKYSEAAWLVPFLTDQTKLNYLLGM